MIKIPEVNIKSLKNRTIIFIVCFSLFFFNSLSLNILFSIYIVITLINHYPETISNIETNLLRNDKQKYPTLNYNHSIENILSKLKRYKRVNPVTYREAMYNWTYFIKNLELLEDDNLYHYNPIYENAFLYLQKSTNSFQSMSVSLKDDIYETKLKYNRFESDDPLQEISDLSKQLYKEGYTLLYNLSVRLNKKWKDNPHVFNKEIILDHPLPNEKHTSRYYDFYV